VSSQALHGELYVKSGYTGPVTLDLRNAAGSKIFGSTTVAVSKSTT